MVRKRGTDFYIRPSKGDGGRECSPVLVNSSSFSMENISSKCFSELEIIKMLWSNSANYFLFLLSKNKKVITFCNVSLQN